MKLIYMQETINYMHQMNPASLSALETLGTPEPVELMNDEGKIKSKYYIYELSTIDSQES